MGDAEYDSKEWFFKSWKPSWALHQFTHPVWLVEFIFDDDGPTEVEFDPVFNLVGAELRLSREEFAFRMEGCCGFSTGQPFTSMQIKSLHDAGIRISLREVCPGHRLIHSETGYYFIANPTLREELAEWMVGQGAAIEIKSIE